uniref:Uncharacterized protein n=1 Tax=Rhizophora mucronata TaxID=61149 RepID=A0A2P2QW94_RHIMU
MHFFMAIKFTVVDLGPQGSGGNFFV